MKVFLFLITVIVLQILFLPPLYAAQQSDFPNAAIGKINSINQNSISIDVSVDFVNFLTYTSHLYNNDCYNDPSASFEIYRTDTGQQVSSQYGERNCYSLNSPYQSLLFPPLQLPIDITF